MEFTTLFEYLQLLRATARVLQVRLTYARGAMQLFELTAHELQRCKKDAMFVLAAAVSDFYIPW